VKSRTDAPNDRGLPVRKRAKGRDARWNHSCSVLHSTMRIDLPALIHELESLHEEMVCLEKGNQAALNQVHPENRSSAINLLHYLALRRHDVRLLQENLAALGLSSLGRTEPHVLNSVRAVMNVLASLHQGERVNLADPDSMCDRDHGHRMLERNAERLLGAEPKDRTVRIMVTMPLEAAVNYELVRDLVEGGMNCMRINCAHDGEQAWAAMIANLRQAEQETGKQCKVEMDVGGPKLRTGPMEPGPAVAKFHPRRDAYGRVERAARIWLTPDRKPEAAPGAADLTVPVPGLWLATLEPGDRVRFTDTRGAKRVMNIVEAVGASRWAECNKSGYVAPGMTLTAVYQHKRHAARRAHVGSIPAKPNAIVLRPGDTLLLTRSLELGRPARYDADGQLLSPAQIGVTLPELFDSAQPGQPIWLDDGKIGGVISQVGPDAVAVKIQHTAAEGEKLQAEKGINIPETALRIPSLTDEDSKHLEFIAKHADILGYSFVRTEADVRLLQARLAELGAGNLSIVLKIETRQGFDNLPGLLLAALQSPSVGVMIARGDLAIECGYERLAEAQEEILWISEAAHVPVIWATQVLETLAKTGTPSRSEITDAAMGERAECVMLNKGPYILEALRTLDNILRRMQAHQEKKRSMLRKLGVATGFATAGAASGPAQA
jgi:pyruvate kinase